ncbi:MAG: nickel-dependent lactate racemase [Verrucomicrobia bacterium]|nr:nickel-dependent lactate racemase [Verrucomicrobiota bacterium]
MHPSAVKTVRLAYGRGQLEVSFPESATIIEPRFIQGLSDEKSAVVRALQNPTQSRPLVEWLKPDSRICVLFTDITRATPNERLIPWLLEELSRSVPRQNITLINSLGTHRPNTREELERMLTADVVDNYRVVNHEPENPDSLVQVGVTRTGRPALINKLVVEADVRIATGFIEPHFFAGFSGGPKGIMPGVAGLKTVMQNHSGANLGSPNATFGVLTGNPIWEEMRDIALMVGPSFLLNVTLNEQRKVTGVFAGDLIEAHRQGCEFVRETAMQPVDAPFDIVVATNSGYPLDQNLYQAVKGISAASRIVKEGGTIIVAAECSDGVPNHSHYERLLDHSSSFEEVFKFILDPGREEPEQWQVIVQMVIQRRAEVMVHSRLPDEKVLGAKMLPCHDIAAAVRERMLGPETRVAVLPQGPLTIPYVR